MQAYSPPPSLWRLVEQYVCVHEQEEIKSMLGLSLVEQSLDLHEEVEMLLDIWREMRDEEETKAAEWRPLPEPPNIRERLIQEIMFFVDNVKEKAKKKGFDPEHILKQHNATVIEYAEEQSRPGSSVGRASRSSDGRETPMMAMSPNRLNAACDLQDGIEAVEKQLNYLDFSSVCTNLRNTLEGEVEQLLQDIQFLQSCLDSQADVRDCITPRNISREPTLTELREERTHLEKEMLSSDTIVATPAVQKPSFAHNHRVLPATPPSPASVSPSSTPRRSAPMKADHNIGHPIAGHGDPAANVSRAARLRQRSTLTNKKLDASDTTGPQASKSDSDIWQSSSAASSLPFESYSHHLSGVSANDGSSGATTTTTTTTVPFPSPPTMSRPDGLGSAAAARRRSGSPGRVRVVDVTTIVDSHLAKTTCHVASTTIQSPPVTSHQHNTTTVMSSGAEQLIEQPTIETTSPGLRPSSANRFRKMVFAYRDGD